MNEKYNILEPEKCSEIIKKKLCLDSINDFSFVYEFELRNQNFGFLGQYFNLKVILENRKTSEVQKLQFFVKMLPKSGAQLDFVKETQSFEIEHGLYVEVFPKILTIEKNFIPQFFLGLKNDALVLEDMNCEGYKMLDKLQFLQLEHCLIIVKNLARFHAGSLIFEKKNRTSIMKFCHENKILINTCDDMCQSTLDSFSKNLIAMVDLIRSINPKKKEEYKTKIAKISAQTYKRIAPSTKFRNVLCHADLWINNVLFKYDENGKVEKCCFIDFQMARYCSPVYDLLFLLYSSTSREFRSKHSQSLFEKYYETLAESLKETEMDIAEMFSWNNLIESMTEIKLSCMIHAFATMSVSFLGSDATYLRIKEVLPISKIVCEEFKKNETYKDRMLDNMLDLYDKLTY